MRKTKISAALICLCAIGSGICAAQEKSAPPDVTIAPKSSAAVMAQVVDPVKEPAISPEEKWGLIRGKIKYVFVLFQENRSFDFYFGSYPGASGLYADANGPYTMGQVAGFTQLIVNTDGSLGTITPFKIPATVKDAKGKTVELYPADIASVNHSHTGIVRKIALDSNGLAQNSEYALTEEGVTLVNGVPSNAPTLERKQFGELVMGHVDCDTAPFLWRYADRFTLFDHFMDTIIGPSTPNAIAMISGQTGETQWMLHPDAATTGGQGKSGIVPLVDDPAPYWGSVLDTANKLRQPQAVPPGKTISKNLTFATLPLSFMGDAIKETTAADYDPDFDLPDVQNDIEKIA
ncbi:MAG: alkaline phosphatase family protein, partial [Terracidiphilus sp.]